MKMKQTKKIADNHNKKGIGQTKSSKIKNVTVREDNEITRLIRIILIVIIVFAVFVGITYFVTHQGNDDTANNQETSIQYTEILVGEIWNKGGEYFVLAGREEDQYLSLYATYLDLYQQNINTDAVYYILNLDSVFNKKYFTDGESNLYTENPSEIRFKDATLLKVHDGKVVEAYEGKDSIITYLKGINQKTEE